MRKMMSYNSVYSTFSKFSRGIGRYHSAVKFAEAACNKSYHEATFKDYLYCLLKNKQVMQAVDQALCSDFVPYPIKAELAKNKDKGEGILSVKLYTFLRNPGEIEKILPFMEMEERYKTIEKLNLAYLKGDSKQVLELYSAYISGNTAVLEESITLNQVLSEVFRLEGKLYEAEKFRFKSIGIEDAVLGGESIIKRWKDEGKYSTTCNLCGGGDLYPAFARPDGMDILRCAGCGLHFVDPMPDANILSDIYGKEYYTGGRIFGYRNNYFRQNKRKIWEERLSVIEAYSVLNENKKMLDIGCADGGFLSLCRERGWNVQGVDLSADACKEAEKKDIRVFCGDIRDAGFRDNTFDCIVLWDLIEHLVDPMRELQEMKRVLNKNGILVMATPNRLKTYILKENWPGFNCSYEHLYYFDPDTLVGYLNKTGMDVELCFSYERGNFTMVDIGHILFMLARKRDK